MKFRTMNRWCVLLFIVLSSASITRTQAPGDPVRANSPGRHTVAGIVFTPDRSPAGRGIPIRLSKGVNDFNTWTDQDGKFTIRGVGNSTYSLIVEAGDEFEPLRERLEIALSSRDPAQTYNFDLRLRFRFGAKAKPGVVDATMAGVPSKAQQHYQDALAAIAKGDHRGGINELLLAVAQYPEFTNAHTELGTQYQKLDQFEKSEEHLRIALKLKPGAYDSLATLGVVLVRLGKHAEAESVLREALKVKDDSAVVHFYLGRALLSQKGPDEAEPEFRAALKLGGSAMIEARRSLANIYLQRGDDRLALEEIEAYLAADTKPTDEKKLRETVKQLKDLLNKTPKP